jgi:hypothetical protein
MQEPGVSKIVSVRLDAGRTTMRAPERRREESRHLVLA